jgi:rod shape-determining protein MreD
MPPGLAQRFRLPLPHRPGPQIAPIPPKVAAPRGPMMAEPGRRQAAMWRLGLMAFAAGLIFLRLMPAPAEAGRWPQPDWLLALVCAVVLRRPEFLPAALLAGMVLAEDLLMLRPPGLWAALVLGGVEFLRARSAFSREVSFLAEWALVACVITLIFAFNRLILMVFLVPQPALGMVGVQMLATIGIYPLAVIVLRLVFGLRKPATGELDAMGQKL